MANATKEELSHDKKDPLDVDDDGSIILFNKTAAL